MSPTFRIISWQQMVLEADPAWQQDARRPWIYDMSNGRRFYARPDPYGPLSDGGLLNDGGVLILTDDSGYPTDPTGLPSGSLWNNGEALGISIIPGGPPQPGTAMLFFPPITASALLLAGGANLPLSDPEVLNMLWNNGNEIAVSGGSQ